MPTEMIVTDLSEEDLAYATCRECGGMQQSNNHLREYALVNGSTRYLHTRCHRTAYSVCHECGITMNVYQAFTGGEHRYCLHHSEVCSDCGVRGYGMSHGVCQECGWTCSSCDTTFSDEESSYRNDWSDSLYCYDCHYDIAENDYDGDLGIRGYGRTHPSRWFGGPLPRDPETGRRIGYYLGFELEIGTDSNDARPIHQWAIDHGMPDFFDCKEDSSVSGFEIATQPFTPEFFEQMVADGRLASFFDMLNARYPLGRGYRGGRAVEESEGHGLHVHVGKVAFGGDDVALAGFAYLLAQDSGKHLERIARRSPTSYCPRVDRPVSTALAALHSSRPQGRRHYAAGLYPSRAALNLTNANTVEVRAFRSTRDAQELAAAVRLTYVGAEYLRYLRAGARTTGLDPKRLKWTEFVRWAAFAHPLAFPSLAGLDEPKPAPAGRTTSTEEHWSFDDFTSEGPTTTPRPRRGPQVEYVIINPGGCVDRNCCPDNFERRELSGLAAVFPPLPVRRRVATSPF